MHATSPTISQPRTGGIRSFGAGLLVSAAVIGGVIIAANVQPIAPSGTANRTDLQSPAWIQAHRAGETGAMTPAERSLLQQRHDLVREHRSRRVGDEGRDEGIRGRRHWKTWL